MLMNIRKATEADLPDILEIINYNILHSTAIYDYKPRSLSDQQKWFAEKQKTGMPVIVAEANEIVTGFGTYGIFRPKEAYKFCVEHSVYVNNHFTGQGIGKQLLTDLIRLAKIQGMHTMIAGIDAENVDSIRFHEKFGFIEAGRLFQAGYKFNRWLDLVFMQMML